MADRAETGAQKAFTVVELLLSFADGHAVIHKWLGPVLRCAPVSLTAAIPLSRVTATTPEDVVDVYWLAENSTVAN